MVIHVQATLIAFRLLPITAALIAAAAWFGGEQQRRSAVLLSGLAMTLALYAAFLAWGPSTTSLAGLQASVIAQKAVSVVLVVVFLLLGTGTQRVGDNALK